MLQILDPLALELHAARQESELRRAFSKHPAGARRAADAEAAAEPSPTGIPELRLRRADGCE